MFKELALGYIFKNVIYYSAGNTLLVLVYNKNTNFQRRKLEKPQEFLKNESILMFLPSS